MNVQDPEARQYTYAEVALHYVFHRDTKSSAWRKYVNQRSKNIVRVKPVSPRFLERFAIRLLAITKKGATSFADLRTGIGFFKVTVHIVWSLFYFSR